MLSTNGVDAQHQWCGALHALQFVTKKKALHL